MGAGSAVVSRALGAVQAVSNSARVSTTGQGYVTVRPRIFVRSVMLAVG
jgi:hypothetical protein